LPDLGSELVVNGTVDSATTGWSPGNSAGLSIIGGRLRVTNPSAWGYAYQSIPTIAGQVYTLTFEISSGTAPGLVSIGTTPSASDIRSTAVNGGSFAAVSSTTYVALYTNVSVNGHYCDFDNISMKQVLHSFLTRNMWWDRIHKH
jgi:hypothetical protein